MKFMKRGKKRSKLAQANIITLVLIVLIVLVSIIIVWNIVQPLIRRTTSGVEIETVTLNLEIDETNTQLGAVSNISVKRSSGKGNLTGIKFVFTNGVNEYVFTNDTTSLNQLETKAYSINLTGTLDGVITGVRIYPIITTGAGKEVIGGMYDTFGEGF